MLIREHFEVKETAVTIITDDSFLPIAKDAVFKAREIIEKKIFEDPYFRTTYDPYPVNGEDDLLIQRMCRASVLADVGPMASVAGAVSTYAVERLQTAGSTHSIVENGGDIAMLTDRPVTLGLYTGDPELKDIALLVSPTDTVKGICSSSGAIGPSVSFGRSDVSTVLSDDVILADAAATRLGNLIVSEMDLGTALESVGSIDGINGCIAYANGKMALFGDVPELITKKIPDEKITRILF